MSPQAPPGLNTPQIIWSLIVGTHESLPHLTYLGRLYCATAMGLVCASSPVPHCVQFVVPRSNQRHLHGTEQMEVERMSTRTFQPTDGREKTPSCPQYASIRGRQDVGYFQSPCNDYWRSVRAKFQTRVSDLDRLKPHFSRAGRVDLSTTYRDNESVRRPSKCISAYDLVQPRLAGRYQIGR